MRQDLALLQTRSYAAVQTQFDPRWLWEVFDGDRDRLNIAHECVDRHPPQETAIRIQYADGHREAYSFGELARLSGACAAWLADRGIRAGKRVALMLDPCLAFYVALFGVLKRGAVAVPLYPLFGPEALRQRFDDCDPALVIVDPARAGVARAFPHHPVVVADETWVNRLSTYSPLPPVPTAARDEAVWQYTSGTSRQWPTAVRHRHQAIVPLALAGRYGQGLEPGDRHCCPSSPAWGHGLWHGTLAPLSFGVAVGAYSGKFHPERLVEGLRAWETSNFAAAATVYRMLRDAGILERTPPAWTKCSFTGEPLDAETAHYVRRWTGVSPAGMYGTTEVGVILANYPGFADFPRKDGTGALGRPLPGAEVAVVGPDGSVLPPDRVGEIAVRRHGQWFPTKDAGLLDEDGYFWYKGRVDDVIISAGWTISAVEVEDVLLQHPAVAEAAVVGAPDALRGLVVQAFVVLRPEQDITVESLQQFVKERLSAHEYPRRVTFVSSLPKTPNGKVDRHALRKAGNA